LPTTAYSNLLASVSLFPCKRDFLLAFDVEFSSDSMSAIFNRNAGVSYCQLELRSGVTNFSLALNLQEITTTASADQAVWDCKDESDCLLTLPVHSRHFIMSLLERSYIDSSLLHLHPSKHRQDSNANLRQCSCVRGPAGRRFSR